MVRSSPVIGADGTVYIGAYDNKIYALHGRTGIKKWEFLTEGGIKGSLAIDVDDTIFAGSFDGKIYALDGRSGTKKWDYQTNGQINYSPAIGDNGTVYIGSGDTKLYALDTKTGDIKWTFKTGGAVYCSPTLGLNGVLYIGSWDSIVYALKTGGQGPAKSPWPMRGQNSQHTSRVPGAKAPVASPPGKTLAWTVGINQKSIDRIYPGKTQAVIQQVFGKPDKTQGQFWGYTGMNLTDGQGNRYGTVWFGFTAGTVQQVRFDK